MNATCAKDKIFWKPQDRKFALRRGKIWWFHLACFRILLCRYFDISLEAFLLTEFRTFGYSSDWFVIMLLNNCGMPVFATYLPNQTASLFREHFQGWFYKQLWVGGRLGEDYLYWAIGQDYRYFPSHMFEASGLKFTENTFCCLSLSKATTFEPICGSGISNKLFFTRVD